MSEYDPAKDGHDSYYAAIEAKRLRGDTHDWEDVVPVRLIELAHEILEDKQVIPELVQRHFKALAATFLAMLGERPEDGTKYYCGECDRYERDPIFLDVERCGKCGELIEASDDD